MKKEPNRAAQITHLMALKEFANSNDIMYHSLILGKYVYNTEVNTMSLWSWFSYQFI
jgi:hypothetical protein